MKLNSTPFLKPLALILLLSIGPNLTACQFSKAARLAEKARLEAEARDKVNAERQEQILAQARRDENVKVQIESEKAEKALAALTQEKNLYNGIAGKYRGTYRTEKGALAIVTVNITPVFSTQFNDTLAKQETAVRAAIEAMTFEVATTLSTDGIQQAENCLKSGVKPEKEPLKSGNSVMSFNCQGPVYLRHYEFFLDNQENSQEPYALTAKQSSDPSAVESQKSLLRARSTDQISKLKAGILKSVSRIGVSIQVQPDPEQIIQLTRE